MDVYDFLKSLPAVLGVAGFFAYIWAGQSRIGGDILKRIVDKLRAFPNLNIEQYGQLTPAKIGKLVQTDEQVRSAVNKDDTDLLRLLIKLQYVLTGLVLIVSALLVGVSVWLYTRPEPLSVNQTGPESVVAQSAGTLVDLDPIQVQWASKGKEETVSVFLENVDSHRRSKKQTVGSNVRSVVFDPATVLEVATNRRYQGKNRIRSVVEWPGRTSVSDPKDVMVGIEVELRFNGRLVAPNGQERTIHTLLATIDRSTERLPSDYWFHGDFVSMTTNGPMVVPLRSTNSNGEVEVPDLERINWFRPVGFVYSGPDDPRIARTRVFH